MQMFTISQQRFKADGTHVEIEDLSASYDNEFIARNYFRMDIIDVTREYKVTGMTWTNDGDDLRIDTDGDGYFIFKFIRPAVKGA